MAADLHSSWIRLQVDLRVNGRRSFQSLGSRRNGSGHGSGHSVDQRHQDGRGHLPGLTVLRLVHAGAGPALRAATELIPDITLLCRVRTATPGAGRHTGKRCFVSVRDGLKTVASRPLQDRDAPRYPLDPPHAPLLLVDTKASPALRASSG